MLRITSATSPGLLRTVLWCITLAASLPAALSTAWGQSRTAEDDAIAERIGVETIRDATIALSAEDMEGRGTAQHGGMKAAKYLADRFAHVGLKPLGDDGTFLQSIAFQSISVRPDSSLQAGDQTLEWATDFVYGRPMYVESEMIEAQGDLVCVDSEARKSTGSTGFGVRHRRRLVLKHKFVRCCRKRAQPETACAHSTRPPLQFGADELST